MLVLVTTCHNLLKEKRLRVDPASAEEDPRVPLPFATCSPVTVWFVAKCRGGPPTPPTPPSTPPLRCLHAKRRYWYPPGARMELLADYLSMTT
jgi:hypothetical protein